MFRTNMLRGGELEALVGPLESQEQGNGAQDKNQPRYIVFLCCAEQADLVKFVMFTFVNTQETKQQKGYNIGSYT